MIHGMVSASYEKYHSSCCYKNMWSKMVLSHYWYSVPYRTVWYSGGEKSNCGPWCWWYLLWRMLSCHHPESPSWSSYNAKLSVIITPFTMRYIRHCIHTEVFYITFTIVPQLVGPFALMDRPHRIFCDSCDSCTRRLLTPLSPTPRRWSLYIMYHSVVCRNRM